MASRVLYHTLPIAIELTNHLLVEVVFIGGKLSKTTQVTIGIDVIKFILSIRADICFMGVGRNDTGRSIPEVNWEGHHIKKSMIIASDYIDAIITEINPVDDIFNDFKQKGITIL